LLVNLRNHSGDACAAGWQLAESYFLLKALPFLLAEGQNDIIFCKITGDKSTIENFVEKHEAVSDELLFLSQHVLVALSTFTCLVKPTVVTAENRKKWTNQL